MVMRATARRSSWACQLVCRVDKPARLLSQSAVITAPVRSCAATYSGQYERPVERFVTQDEVDLALRRVARQSGAWHQVNVAEKISILEDMRCRMIKCCLQMGRRGAKVCSSAV